MHAHTIKKVLVVDDEPYNVLALQLLLNRLEIKGLESIVDRAYNGMEAFKKVQKSFN